MQQPARELSSIHARIYEHSYLAFGPAAGGPMDDLLGHSVTYRVAMGPRAGQKVFTLQAVPAEPPEEPTKGVAQTAGFSLHAGIGIEADARGKLERLCRYVSRPPWPRSGSRARSAATSAFSSRRRIATERRRT